LKYSLEEASNVCTPSHNSKRTLIKGCKYTSISFSGDFGPGMIIDKIKDVCFMQIHGGRL
jgi:hypothetical protein